VADRATCAGADGLVFLDEGSRVTFSVSALSLEVSDAKFASVPKERQGVDGPIYPSTVEFGWI